MSDPSAGHGGYVSFEDFFERTFDALLARAIMLCGDRDRAEQAIADTYVKAYNRWEQIGAPWAWAVKVMSRELAAAARRDKRRRDKEVKRMLEVPLPPDMLPEEKAEFALVMRAIRQLPRRQCQVIGMYYLCDMTQREIAETLGIRRVTVAGNLRIALRALRHLLGVTAPAPAEPGDMLVPAPRPAPAGTRAAVADPVAARLLFAATWLARGSRADGRARARVREQVRAHLPEGERG
ncbi:MAG TPA: sigma-70 family RNA polymerase sigma factor [Streptosporangiaceae bacterium]|nr:sigma-70 family RNA polymerase sigma factor [Streptosporangiaceae bacterium]